MDQRRLRLRYWRQKRVMTTAELAERSGVAKPTIIKLERPDHPPARPTTVRKLAAALGIEPADLYEGEPIEDRDEGKVAA